MNYPKATRVFTTIVFAILLVTFGTILNASMQQQRASAANEHVSASSVIEQSFSQDETCDQSGQGGNSPTCIDIIFPSGSSTFPINEY